jgi:SAM-dependent methyltransferase
VGSGEWEAEAENWVRWARTPGHDAYWHYHDGFFDDLVGVAGITGVARVAPSRVIDIGCGEGRTTRVLQARGHHVVGVDSSPTLLGYARQADSAGTYLLADAAALPFAAASFDMAVAYNSLMDVADMPGTVHEAARVLVGGGCLCISVTHPLNDAGAFASDAPDAPFTITGSYFGPRRFEETFERDGLTMTFRGWCYAIEDYAQALAAAGFLIEAVREPVPTTYSGRYARWHRVPMFLQLRAVKR